MNSSWPPSRWVAARLFHGTLLTDPKLLLKQPSHTSSKTLISPCIHQHRTHDTDSEENFIIFVGKFSLHLTLLNCSLVDDSVILTL